MKDFCKNKRKWYNIVVIGFCSGSGIKEVLVLLDLENYEEVGKLGELYGCNM